jgi:hypothetical protein
MRRPWPTGGCHAKNKQEREREFLYCTEFKFLKSNDVVTQKFANAYRIVVT